MKREPEYIQYRGINLMKFVCAIFVVMVHTNPFLGISENINYFLVNILSRVAVPFYFICSGYFLYNKLSIDNYKIRKCTLSKYIVSILDLYLLWTILYLVFNFKSYFLDLEFIKGCIIFIRNFVFIGVQFHLWYLVALCTSILLIYFVIKKYNFKVLIILAVAMYTSLLFMGPYYGILDSSFIKKVIDKISYVVGTPWNSFIMGFPLIVLGICINKYHLQEKSKKTVLICIITFILYMIEINIINKLDISKTSSVSIFLIIFTASIFILLINSENKLSKLKWVEKYSNQFKELSLLIYLVHGIFLVILPKVYIILRIDKIQYLSLINFILVTICSILISQYIIKSKKSIIKFIRKPDIINNIKYKLMKKRVYKI